ncbi:hypothetical protein JNW90_21035 [Micromonospora sp. STR1s_5]|nr:hypothetical protein [Micromonospora sp. STR1s_5]
MVSPNHDPFRRRKAKRGEGEERTQPASKLFIPYFPGDVGDRSVGFPTGVLWYWCEGIQIRLPDGSLYTGGRLPRDEVSKVVVQVANGGSGPTWAQVTVYWTEPSAGFGPPHLHRGPELGPAVNVRVPVGYTVSAPAITLTPSLTTPDHICLIAVVNAIRDSAPGTWAPGADRHYAQHNVLLEIVSAKTLTAVDFFAKNPFADSEARVAVSVLPASREATVNLAERYGAEPLELDPGYLRLGLGGRPLEPLRQIQLELPPGERERCQVLVAPGALKSGQFAVAEIATRATAKNGKSADHDGGIALVLFGAD